MTIKVSGMGFQVSPVDHVLVVPVFRVFAIRIDLVRSFAYYLALIISVPSAPCNRLTLTLATYDKLQTRDS